jgi:uncharacterized protein
MLSRYLREVSKNGKTAVFHALRPVPIFLDTSDWERYKSAPEENGGLGERLVDQRLLIDTPVQDDAFRDEIKMLTLNRGMMSILYLVLTKACNFRCRQCFQYERHPDLHPELAGVSSLMSLEIARAGIDSFANHIAESDVGELETQIYFYGGEPLLNWDVLVGSVEYANSLKGSSLPEDTTYMIVCNGSLVDEVKAKFFAEHGISVGLSMDGPKEKNDAFRLSARGEGTFDSIERALRILQQHRVNVTLSITVNPNIVLDLPDIVRWAKDEMNVESISFNFVGGASYAYTGAEMPLDEYDSVLARKMVEAYVMARNIGIYEDKVSRKVDDFIDHSFKAVDCGAINNQLVIQPYGNIAFCHASNDYNVGSVTDPDFRIFGHPDIGEWENVLPINNPGCQSCPAISICGYGCFHHVRELGRPLAGKDNQFCKHTKAVMEFLVWDLWEKSQQQKEVLAA